MGWIMYSGARIRSEPAIPHTKAVCMSRRNGDRARFQKERKRKMLRRQRVQEFIAAGTDAAPAASTSAPAARKGGPRKGGAATKTAAATKAVSAKA